MATRGELPEIVGNLDDRLTEMEAIVLNPNLKTGELKKLRGLVGGFRLDLIALQSYRVSLAKGLFLILMGDRSSRHLQELEDDFLDLYEEQKAA